MFLKDQNKASIEYYKKMLRIIGSLSRLFSDNTVPYVDSRIAENLFCRAFDAKNLSRADCSADASKNNLGIGIKTFLDKNGSSREKIAEFNGEHNLFKDLAPKNKIKKISELRNKRLDTTKRIYALDDLIYHYVTRKSGEISVSEVKMDDVDLKHIKDIKINGNVIYFNDGKSEYSFNSSKSTLYKKFITNQSSFSIPVSISKNPFLDLEKLFSELDTNTGLSKDKEKSYVYLPLYSQKKKEKEVSKSSGLNQWNASGRQRNVNEIYIPIPAWVHRKFPGFFPEKDQSFVLSLPDGKELSAKLCQENSKALMTNPNSALGEWLLRRVLNLKERELLTYEKLEEIGLDSVVIIKKSSNSFEIDFAQTGSFENFQIKNNI